MVKAIRLQQYGGPEVLKWMDVEVGEPREGEVRIRHKAVGLNYVEIYQREGLYPLALPSGLGQEGAGVIEAVGPSVTGLKPGDRVAYGLAPPGAYAESRLMPVSNLVPLPDDISDRVAASIMLKGMTAHYLLHRSYPVKSGTYILVHAAAGGVGTLLTQWARQLGATVIGTVGSEAKASHARTHGCHHVIQYRRENFCDRVYEITQGQGVHVVYDGVGKATFEGSLDSLRRLGTMVNFGNASGPVESFRLNDLVRRGSLFFTRTSLPHYVATHEELLATANSVFEAVRTRAVRVEIGQTFALKDVALAHSDLESRKTIGATVLVP